MTSLAAASDENLFSGMCYRPDIAHDPESSEQSPSQAHPAHAVSHAELSRHKSASPSRRSHSAVSTRQFSPPPQDSMRPFVKKMTFSDLGGLLARAPSRASTLQVDDENIGPLDEVSPTRHHMRNMNDSSTRAGTPATLQDVGGFLNGMGGYHALAGAMDKRTTT